MRVLVDGAGGYFGTRLALSGNLKALRANELRLETPSEPPVPRRGALNVLVLAVDVPHTSGGSSAQRLASGSEASSSS